MPRRSVAGARYYTTHQVAGFLGVSLPTIVNWVKAGRLDCHRTVGGHRRIGRADLIAFARQNTIPLPAEVLDPEPGRRKRVLVIDPDRAWSETLPDYLRATADLEVEVAASAFDAGLAMGRFGPDLVLVSLQMPDLNAAEMRRQLSRIEELATVPVLACTSDPEGAGKRDGIRGVFDGWIEKPVELETLLTRILEQLGVPLPTLP